MKWAHEFCRHFPSVPEDEAFGWFADAIDAGRIGVRTALATIVAREHEARSLRRAAEA